MPQSGVTALAATSAVSVIMPRTRARAVIAAAASRVACVQVASATLNG